MRWTTEDLGSALARLDFVAPAGNAQAPSSGPSWSDVRPEVVELEREEARRVAAGGISQPVAIKLVILLVYARKDMECRAVQVGSDDAGDFELLRHNTKNDTCKNRYCDPPAMPVMQQAHVCT